EEQVTAAANPTGPHRMERCPPTGTVARNRHAASWTTARSCSDDQPTKKGRPPLERGPSLLLRLGRARRNSRLTSRHLREVGQPTAALRLAQLPQAATLDLADALAGDAEVTGHLVQRPGVAVPQPEAQLDHLAVARRQRPQHLAHPLLEQVLVR